MKSKKLYEKTIQSRIAYDGHFLKVQKDQVELPNGQTSYREFIHHPGAAMMIPVLDNGDLVMLKQFRYALKKVFLEFPAGKIDSGEDVLTTAQRELREETGYTASVWKHLTTIHPVIGYADEKIDIFLAQKLTHEGVPADYGDKGEEFLEIEIISPAELMRKIQKLEVTDVKTMIGGFWYNQMLQGHW